MRQLLGHYALLASRHDLMSVLVGLAAAEGDLLFPELVDWFESALRVDDRIFRMTRERAVLFLADVDRERAGEIVERGLAGFRGQFSLVSDPEVAVGYFPLGPGSGKVTVKDVLPVLFADQGRSLRN
jgi:GGDEF domain-containing protein